MSQKIPTAHGLLAIVILLGVLVLLTRTTWQDALASYMPALGSYLVVTPSGKGASETTKSAVVPHEQTEEMIKNFFSTEKKYVYLCGWTAQAGTFYPDGTVYEKGTLEYNPDEETRANAGYGTWSLEGSVLKGYFGPYGEEKITLKSFQFESGYVLSDTAQPHEECTYLFADSNDTLKRYTASFEGFKWSSIDFVFKITPNKNSKPAPTDSTLEVQ